MTNITKGRVNKCFKDIDLEKKIYKHFMRKEKINTFLGNFFLNFFHKSDIKIYLE